jgi:hypothetical protein
MLLRVNLSVDITFRGRSGAALVSYYVLLGFWRSTVIYSNSVLNILPRAISTAPRFLRLMGLILQLWLTWLAVFLALLQTLTTLTFGIWLNVFGVWPSRILRVQDSAILILNAENGA